MFSHRRRVPRFPPLLAKAVLHEGGRKQSYRQNENVDSSEMIERLERLADMRRDGWLTATEFHDAKASVLTGKMPGGSKARDIESRAPIPRDERKERRAAARAGFLDDQEESS